MTRSRQILCVLGAGAALATAAAAPAQPQQSQPRRTLYVAKSLRSLPTTSFVRTRDCVRRPHTCVNGVRGLELVYLTKGRIPARATTATVLSDTNCAADRNAISHCSNILRLASGRRITVRHDHSMMNEPLPQPRRARPRPQPPLTTRLRQKTDDEGVETLIRARSVSYSLDRKGAS